MITDQSFFAELLGDREPEPSTPSSYGTGNTLEDPREDPREEPGEDSAIDLERVLEEVPR